MPNPSLFSVLHTKTDTASWTKAAESIQKRGNTLQLDVHLYLHAVAVAWKAHDDIRTVVSRCNLLIAHLPLGFRTKAVNEWVERMFGLIMSVEEKAFVAHAKPVITGKTIDLEKIKNTRWFDFKKEPEYKGLDFSAQLIKLVDAADKRMAKPNEKDKIDQDLTSRVRNALTPKPVTAEDAFAEALLLSPLDRDRMVSMLLASVPAPLAMQA
jgi:hypothetical protein